MTSQVTVTILILKLKLYFSLKILNFSVSIPLTTKILLLSSEKYPYTGPISSSLLKKEPIFSRLPVAAPSSAYQGDSTELNSTFNFLIRDSTRSS